MLLWFGIKNYIQNMHVVFPMFQYFLVLVEGRGGPPPHCINPNNFMHSFCKSYYQYLGLVSSSCCYNYMTN